MLEYLIDIFYQLFGFIIDDANENTSTFEGTAFIEEKKDPTAFRDFFLLPDVVEADLIKRMGGISVKASTE